MGCASCSSGADGKPAGCKSNGYCSASGCNKLGVFDWLTGVPLPQGQQPFDAVEVRFKNTRKTFHRCPPSLGVVPGDAVVVEAGQGHDIGVVSLTGELVRAQMARKEKEQDTFELRKVIRKATQEDLDRWHAARKLEDETLFATRVIAREARLDMKVTDVEYQGDGTKATFYYTAEERIDFRDLVRRLSDRFHVRVEMKQIGARQEAGRIGGIGSCGRELCCSTWLSDFRSVTTSAARYQQLALNPQKLAGQCGKLKCCLNYELDMYIEAIKSYPSQNAKLKTRQGTGAHIKTDIFTERMFYGFKRPGEPFIMASFPVEVVRDILEQNKQGVEPEVDLNMVDVPAVPEEKAPDYENVVGQDELTRFDQKMKSRGAGGGKRGGRKRKDRERPREGGPARPKPEGSGAEPRKASPRPPGEGEPRGERGGRRDRRGRRDRGPRPDKPGGPSPAQPPQA
jgi:cell fate regulator YaaT (PSP1 superfamily)